MGKHNQKVRHPTHSAQLSEKLLLACETALAYYLALSFTPFAQWLAENGTPEGATLQTEITAETSKAWQFVVDREVEAPERFQAIQSYRAAMAVMHQQLGFVGELYQSGMIDEAEREKMEEPIGACVTYRFCVEMLVANFFTQTHPRLHQRCASPHWSTLAPRGAPPAHERS